MDSHLKRQTRDIVVLGESGVGKTCITDRFLKDTHFARYDPFLQASSSRELQIDNEIWTLTVADISSELFRSPPQALTVDFLSDTVLSASGILLLYDITSLASYEHITTSSYDRLLKGRHLRSHYDDGNPYPLGHPRFGCVLVGNKLDVVEKDAGRREVRKELAEEWARMHGWKAFEMDSFGRENVEEAFRALVKSMKWAERRDAEDIELGVEGIRRENERYRMVFKRPGKEEKGEVEDAEVHQNEQVEAEAGKEDKMTKKDKGGSSSGLKGSMSRLRDALPRMGNKSKTPT